MLENERFIHDILLQRVAPGVAALYDEWREKRRITPFFLSWPAVTIYDEQGEPIEGVCRMDLSSVQRDRWTKTIVQAVQRTQAYAILLCEQRDSDVQIILESHHGSRCWTLPIERHGDIKVLGPASTRDDTECLGILWRPNLARS